MKELFFVPALVILTCSSLYGFSRVDTLKIENRVLQSQLEATENENERLTQQILGMLSNR